MRWVRRFASGVALLAGLVVVFGAMPAVVWFGVGWPLPHVVPAWSDVTTVLSTSGISDAELLDVLSIVFWLLWLDLVLAFVIEVVARLRGMRAPRVPLAGPLQALAAEVTSLLVITLSSLGPRSSDVPHVTPLLSAVLAVDTHPPTPVLPGESTRVSASVAQLPSPRVGTTAYTVQRGDSEWSIAGHRYGDPRRWPAIWEENEGREEPGGRRFTNPSLILPGWQLDIPDLGGTTSATSPPPAAPTAPPGPPRPVPPAMTAPQARPESVDPPIGNASGAPAVPSPLGQGTTPAPTSHASDTPQAAPTARVDLPLGGAIGLSLAAAITGAVAIARRHESRRRRVGQATASRVDTHLLGPSVRAARRAVARSTLGEEAEVRAPRVLHQLFEDMPGRTPVATPSTPGLEELSVDAADLAGIALAGPGAERAARAIILGVLGHHTPHRAEVMVVGSASRLMPGLAQVPGATVVSDVGEAAAVIDDEFARRSRTLHRRGLHDYRETAGSHDPFDVLLVVVESTDLAVRPITLDAAILVGVQLGIAVLGVGPLDGFRAVNVDDDGMLSERIGTAAPGDRLHVLAEPEAREFLEVIAASRGAGIVAAGAPTTDPDQEPPLAVEGPAHRPVSDASRPVELRLFGRPQVLAEGSEVRSGLRTRARGLLVLLGIRAAGVTPDEALVALWHEAGDEDANSSYFYTVVTSVRRRLRAVLGRKVDVIVSGAERFELDAKEVDVDLWRFDAALADAARAGDVPSRRDALERAAVEVRGEPVEGIQYEWAEPVRERIRRRAVDVLCDLAHLRAGSGELDDAIALVERALQLDAGSEDLYRRLMRLQQEAGRPDAARRAFQQCILELEDLGVEPDDETLAVAHATSSVRPNESPDDQLAMGAERQPA